MRFLRREFGRGGAGVSLVRQHVNVKDWIRRLGWWGLWLVAQRCLQLWLADQTYTPLRRVREHLLSGARSEDGGEFGLFKHREGH